MSKNVIEANSLLAAALRAVLRDHREALSWEVAGMCDAALDVQDTPSVEERSSRGADGSAIYKRLMQALGARTQVEMAQRLGLRQSSISSSCNKEKLPSGWLLTAYRLGVDVTWVETGVGAGPEAAKE